MWSIENSRENECEESSSQPKPKARKKYGNIVETLIDIMEKLPGRGSVVMKEGDYENHDNESHALDNSDVTLLVHLMQR